MYSIFKHHVIHSCDTKLWTHSIRNTCVQKLWSSWLLVSTWKSFDLAVIECGICRLLPPGSKTIKSGKEIYYCALLAHWYLGRITQNASLGRMERLLDLGWIQKVRLVTNANYFWFFWWIDAQFMQRGNCTNVPMCRNRRNIAPLQQSLPFLFIFFPHTYLKM